MRRIVAVIGAVTIMVAAMMVLAVPVVAQAEKGKGKQKQQKKATPDSSGISAGSLALLGVGASTMVAGGAILVRVRTRY